MCMAVFTSANVQLCLGCTKLNMSGVGLCSNTGRVYFAVANHLDIDEISDKALFMYKTSTILMSRGGAHISPVFLVIYSKYFPPYSIFALEKKLDVISSCLSTY